MVAISLASKLVQLSVGGSIGHQPGCHQLRVSIQRAAVARLETVKYTSTQSTRLLSLVSASDNMVNKITYVDLLLTSLRTDRSRSTFFDSKALAAKGQFIKPALPNPFARYACAGALSPSKSAMCHSVLIVQRLNFQRWHGIRFIRIVLWCSHIRVTLRETLASSVVSLAMMRWEQRTFQYCSATLHVF